MPLRSALPAPDGVLRTRLGRVAITLLVGIAALVGPDGRSPGGLAGAAEPAAGPSPAPRVRVYLVPLGRSLPEADVALVAEALRGVLAVEVERLAVVPLPAAAYYRPTRRYRAERLLDFLGGLRPAGAAEQDRVLGLTDVDISTTKGRHADWGILGLATLDGRTGVLSSFRARRRAPDAATARVRLGKVAVHEIGHTLGLEHCPTRGCLMEDARGSVLTCDREYDLCDRCRTLLRRRGIDLPTARLPWPRPSVR